jgi:hypothetical protein
MIYVRYLGLVVDKLAYLKNLQPVANRLWFVIVPLDEILTSDVVLQKRTVYFVLSSNGA